MIDPDGLTREFEAAFGRPPRIFRAPGRVNLIGEHTDYNDGFVMPMAIDRSTWVAAAPRPDRTLVVQSREFGDRREVHLDDVGRGRSGHWSDYVRGITAVLERSAPSLRGADCYVASDVPKIASNNRMTATPEEYAGIMRRSLSVFGTWTVDEANKTVTYHIVSSSFPNWEGEAQTRTIDKLTDDEFVNTNPNVAGGRGSASNLYRRVR